MFSAEMLIVREIKRLAAKIESDLLRGIEVTEQIAIASMRALEEVAQCSDVVSAEVAQKEIAEMDWPSAEEVARVFSPESMAIPPDEEIPF